MIDEMGEENVFSVGGREKKKRIVGRGSGSTVVYNLI